MYSFSQLKTFSTCPRLYYYVYERGLRLPPALPLVEGRAYHKAVEQANRAKLEGRDISSHELVDRFVVDLEEGAREAEFERSEVDEAKDTGRILLPAYHGTVHASLTPEAVEHRIEWDLEGRPFVGIVDLLEPARVVDYKVTSRPKTGADLRRDPQLGLYARVTGRVQVAHIQFVRGHGVPDLRVVETMLTPGNLEDVERWALAQVQGIEACRSSGVWPFCAMDSWRCGPRHCGFYGTCYRKES